MRQGKRKHGRCIREERNRQEISASLEMNRIQENAVCCGYKASTTSVSLSDFRLMFFQCTAPFSSFADNLHSWCEVRHIKTPRRKWRHTTDVTEKKGDLKKRKLL
jgi:hypothetical protein